MPDLILTATVPAGLLSLLLALTLAGLRLLKVAVPLNDRLHERWRWVPTAATAALGVLSVGLPGASTWLGFAEVVGLAVITAALAAAPGHGPKEEKT